jgi:hypothetical protein
MLERALPSGVRPEVVGGDETCLDDSFSIDLSRLAAYSAGEGICFSDSSFSTARREIGVLGSGRGGGNTRLSTAGVEIAGYKNIFPKFVNRKRPKSKVRATARQGFLFQALLVVSETDRNTANACNRGEVKTLTQSRKERQEDR